MDTVQSLQELFLHPAQYMHVASIARPINAQQIQEQLYAVNLQQRLALYEQQFFTDLLSEGSTALADSIAETVHHTINQQLADLRWNRLPWHAFSIIFSCLPTKQVLSLRTVSPVWRAAGRSPMSFNNR